MFSTGAIVSVRACDNVLGCSPYNILFLYTEIWLDKYINNEIQPTLRYSRYSSIASFVGDIQWIPLKDNHHDVRITILLRCITGLQHIHTLINRCDTLQDLLIHQLETDTNLGVWCQHATASAFTYYSVKFMLQEICFALCTGLVAKCSVSEYPPPGWVQLLLDPHLPDLIHSLIIPSNCHPTQKAWLYNTVSSTCILHLCVCSCCWLTLWCLVHCPLASRMFVYPSYKIVLNKRISMPLTKWTVIILSLQAFLQICWCIIT